MSYKYIGRKVKFSPRGEGLIEAISEAGFPTINDVTVAWCIFEDGEIFDPYNVRDKTTID